MNKKVMVGALLLGLISVWSAFGAKVVGEITYLKGDVSISRNGKVLKGSQVKVGDAVEDFDIIRTGANGTLDLIVWNSKKQEIQLKVQNNTAFSIEMAKLEGGKKDKSTFQMMSGTLACKVDKLSGNEVQVKTKSAAMGVRGTKFTVSTAPTDDMLVTCDEGEVSCTDEEGEEVSATPDQAVELLADEGQFRNLKVTKETLESFRKNWFVKRIEVFKALAPQVVKNLSAGFYKSYEGLVKAYNALKKHSDVINKWIREDAQGKMGSRLELMKEKKKIIGALFAIKINLFVFQHIYFRLLEVEEYVNQGAGGADPAVKKFFADLQAKKQTVEIMLADIAYVIKLYSIRNNGYFPGDALGTPDDKFFDEGEEGLDSLGDMF